VGAVFELLNVEVDLQFLLSVRSLSQFASDEAVCRRSARLFRPNAFAGSVIVLTSLQLAEPAIAADHRFDRNEIDQIVPVISEDGIT
jgi:hypothetical protein